jgi:radical SAM superfamily enzyme YgiQ (UPF0313 family)
MPLGLLSTATVLQHSGHEEVFVFDADHQREESILQQIVSEAPDILGINFNVFNTRLLDRIARAGKESGSLVVVGGQAATPIPERLLSSNPNIDAVVVYDGEKPMKAIVELVANGGDGVEGIPNIVTRKGMGTFRFSTSPYVAPAAGVENPSLDLYPIIDRTVGGVDFQRYLRAWNRPDIDPLRVPTSIYFQKGCGRTCTFCARVDKRLRRRPPKQIVEEVQGLRNCGVNYLYVVDDTISADPSFLSELLAEIERVGNGFLRFWAFADIRDLSEETALLLARLGAEKLLIGVESGSEKLRKNSGKMFTNEMLLRRLARLGSLGIKVEDSYVLGLPGESIETLAETYELAAQVLGVCQTEGTAFNIMTPLLGSPDWNRLMHIPGLADKYKTGYQFDIDEVRQDFLNAFCHLPASEVSDTVDGMSSSFSPLFVSMGDGR